MFIFSLKQWPLRLWLWRYFSYYKISPLWLNGRLEKLFFYINRPAWSPDLVDLRLKSTKWVLFYKMGWNFFCRLIKTNLMLYWKYGFSFRKDVNLSSSSWCQLQFCSYFLSVPFCKGNSSQCALRIMFTWYFWNI